MFEIWQDVKTQWRAGPAGVIGLDYAEVRQAFNEFGIEYTRRNKCKIMLMERIYLENVYARDK